jgi:serine protease inhibitor
MKPPSCWYCLVRTWIEQLEAKISSQPELVESMLASSWGDVTLPPFHFSFETDLRGATEKLGIRRVFSELRSLQPMAPTMGGVIRGIAQKTEITLDETGIRADSGTIMSGILGGLVETPLEPFHMILDRPFLFFIRDNATRALIFEGAVMNPAVR